jgi:hypothetical protein
MLKTTKSAKASPIELLKAYKEYTDVFSKERAITLVQYSIQDHAIDLEPYTMPP